MMWIAVVVSFFGGAIIGFIVAAVLAAGSDKREG